MIELLLDRNCHVPLVYSQEKTSREVVRRIAGCVIYAFGVVKDRYQYMGLVLSAKSNVMLSREPQFFANREISLRTTKSPDYALGVFRDLVNGISMSARIQIIAVRCLVNGVGVAITR